MKDYKVIHIGPSIKTQGGISSVLKIYREQLAGALNFSFIPSYSGRGRWKDIILFTAALFTVFVSCLAGRNIIYHIHVASRGSYLRKSIIARVCLLFRRKVILHIHGGRFDYFIENSGDLKKKRIIGLMNRADRIVVLSQSWRSYFRQYLPDDKIVVLHNPCPTIAPSYNKPTEMPVRLVFIGRLCRAKGAWDLVDAIGRMDACGMRLDMYGNGENEWIKSLVEQKGLDGIISVHEWVSNDTINRVLDSAHILVLPSYYEGLPMSILEAMSKGLAIVAGNVGGIPEAVIDNENGFLVKPGDIETLADRMSRLVRDPDLRAKMGARSLVIARQKFSIRSVQCQLSLLYRDVVQDEL